MQSFEKAPGHPGDPPTWTSGAKSGVGTAIGGSSRVWFSISHGTLEEVYYPRVDLACIRDCCLLVTDGREFFSDERKDTNHQAAYLEEGVSGYRLTNTCKQGRYRIEKQIITDPRQSGLLMSVRFIPCAGMLSDYHMYVVLAPHLGNHGEGNTAWAGEYKGVQMLFAHRESLAVAMACSVPWKKQSVGFVGTSDGWHDIAEHKQMVWTYQKAEEGNVALTGEIDLTAKNGEFLLVLGFGDDPQEAGLRVITSLYESFESLKDEYVAGWREWQKQMRGDGKPNRENKDMLRISGAVIHVHEAKGFPSVVIASLFVPWGENRGDKDLGGYHVVWVRDMVEAASGLLAGGVRDLAPLSIPLVS